MVKAMPEKVLESMVAHSPIGRAWEHRKMLPTHRDTRFNVGQHKCLVSVNCQRQISQENTFKSLYPKRLSEYSQATAS
jgi:hypothetical protein